MSLYSVYDTNPHQLKEGVLCFPIYFKHEHKVTMLVSVLNVSK